MEPHSDKKGRLAGKFEDFSFTPKDEVWERIVAEPSDRPLGAMFWAFAWMPKKRVWRRISAQLHPVPMVQTVAWSSAAAAAIALLVWFAWGALGEAPNSQLSGKHLMAMHWQECLSDRNDGPNDSKLDVVNDPNGNKGNQTTTPLTQGTWKAKHDNHLATQGNKNLVPHSQQRNPKKGTTQQALPAPTYADLEQPIFAGLLERSLHLSPSLQAIDQRTNFIGMMAIERQNEAQRKLDADFQSLLEQEKPVLMAMNTAQAGGSLGTGGKGIEGALSDFNTPGVIDVLGVANNLADLRISSETFQTPLILDASVDHRFAKGLGFGGGLVYTKMQSSLDYNSNGLSQRLAITRQYLGLATNLSYSHRLLPKSERLAGYTSAGIQLDYGLGKHRVLNSRLIGQSETQTVDNVKLGGQASANIALGMRYELFKHFSLYAQGTAAHYFLYTDANLFTANKVWPSMQLGLRVAL